MYNISNMKFSYILVIISYSAHHYEAVCTTGCEFPFKYNGKSHTACTLDGSSSYWCVTENGWKYCADDCPKEEKAKESCSSNCTFPFEYHGKTFEACTKYHETQYWCKTNTGWTYCNEDCPTESPKISGSCTATNGENCFFPFIYNGTKYDSCTDVNNSGLFWCATSVNSDGTYQNWGFCSESCSKETTSTEKTTTKKKPKKG